MSEGRLRVIVPGQPDRVAALPAGVSVVVGRRPEPAGDERGLEVDARGVSRRHVALRTVAGAVEVRDLGSTNHTFLDGAPVTAVRLTGARGTLRIGQALLVVEPPPDADRTGVLRLMRITAPGLRMKLLALCRDHVIPPRGRGAWVLTSEDLSSLLAVNGTPRPSSVADDVKDIKRLAGIPGATTPQLIDWAIATREVVDADMAELDAHLMERFGQTYQERILEIPRGQFLRGLLRAHGDEG
ncbi:MAG TPA: FHA domain-containing protein [Miltoncostaeaceae bacterium]|nr:FHA domain-containing protein [Miltoncostaeaceae bacterium]